MASESKRPLLRRSTDALRVLLVDDHDFFRGGLRRLLFEHGMRDIHDAASGEEGVKQVAELAPDVVIMDLNMPTMSGIEATARISEIAPNARVLVLTVTDDDDVVMDAIAAGADGYLLKSATPEQIIDGVKAASQGESLISPRIAARIVERMRHAGARDRRREIAHVLSEREVEVLRLVSEGQENAEIAQALFISPRTVKNHIANILQKLHMENRIQAAVFAARSGILDEASSRGT
jgi:DNA-binding NarL/FixJ family response regulator